MRSAHLGLLRVVFVEVCGPEQPDMAVLIEALQGLVGIDVGEGQRERRNRVRHDGTLARRAELCAVDTTDLAYRLQRPPASPRKEDCDSHSAFSERNSQLTKGSTYL